MGLIGVGVSLALLLTAVMVGWLGTVDQIRPDIPRFPLHRDDGVLLGVFAATVLAISLIGPPLVARAQHIGDRWYARLHKPQIKTRSTLSLSGCCRVVALSHGTRR